MTFYYKQAYYITESAGNILVLILFYFIVLFPLSICSFIYLLVQGDDVSRRILITSFHNFPKATEGKWLLPCEVNMQHFSTLWGDICDFFFFKRKCENYEITQALHTLRTMHRNRQFLWQKCNVFEKMRPSHNYAGFGWLCVKSCDRINRIFLEGLVEPGKGQRQTVETNFEANYCLKYHYCKRGTFTETKRHRPNNKKLTQTKSTERCAHTYDNSLYVMVTHCIPKETLDTQNF